jgi:APA family basic amino acid/polyamine antiporter
VFLGVIGTLLALTGTYEQLYSLFVFALWIFMGLTAIAVLRLRWKEPELARPFRAWGYPVTPMVFLLAAIALTLSLLRENPVRSALGLVVIGAGVPFYFAWRKSGEKAAMVARDDD